jgi:hypothetical protein
LPKDSTGNKAAENQENTFPITKVSKTMALSNNFTYNSWLSNLLENPTKKAVPQG